MFSVTTYNFDTLSERLRESAFLLKGLKIELIDERHDVQETFIMRQALKPLLLI